MTSSKTTRRQKIKKSDKKSDGNAQASKSVQLQEFFVPGRGSVMAADIHDVRNRLREEGDGNS